MQQATLEVLQGDLSPYGLNRWTAVLARLFDEASALQRHMQVEIRAKRLSVPTFMFGRGLAPSLPSAFDLLYPVTLTDSFEGVASISGGVWLGAELYANGRDDALTRLEFGAGTVELPLHVHEFSDRVIFVLAGHGWFHWSGASLDQFSGQDVQSVAVVGGDVLVFTRGLLHTFNAGPAPLSLLSYHAPFIVLDDPRQYTLPPVRWVPH